MENISSEGKDKKLNSAFETMMEHHTTIIAIILGIAAMIGTHFNQLEAAAQDKTDQIENRRSTNADNLAEAANKVEEYTLEENADSSSDEYAALITEFKGRQDSLAGEEIKLKVEETSVKNTLENVKKQGDRGDVAEAIFEFSIILSSIGVTNKKKYLGLTALVLTLVGVLIIVSMFLL